MVESDDVIVWCQALEWIHDYGEAYLNSHTHLGANKQETEGLLKEHYDFRNRAKVDIPDWSRHVVEDG